MAGYGRTPPIRFFFFFSQQIVNGTDVANESPAWAVTVIHTRFKCCSCGGKSLPVLLEKLLSSGRPLQMEYQVQCNTLGTFSCMFLLVFCHPQAVFGLLKLSIRNIRLVHSLCLEVMVKILLDGDHVNYPIGLGAAQHSNWIAVLSRRFRDRLKRTTRQCVV